MLAWHFYIRRSDSVLFQNTHLIVRDRAYRKVHNLFTLGKIQLSDETKKLVASRIPL